MMSARTFAVPGVERCDICGNSLSDRSFGEYEYHMRHGEVPRMHHVSCEEVFREQMRQAQTHLIMCHLEFCDCMPMPTRWIDKDPNID